MIVAIALFALLDFAAHAQATLTPPDWNLGRVEIGGSVTRTVTAANAGTEPAVLTLVTTCGCLQAEPSRVELAPRAQAPIVLRYTAEEPGKVSVYFVVRSSPPGASGGATWLYQVRGNIEPPSKALVEGPQAAAPAAPPATAAAPAAVEVRFYYAPGCRSCELLLARIKARIPATAAVTRRSVLDPAALDELLAASGSSSLPALPAAVVGGRVLSGEAGIEAGIAEAIAAAGGRAGQAPAATGGGAAEVARRLAAPALFAAGLVDGINPCAFTTIIFLLTTLVLAGRRRGEILVVGSAFTLAVFSTYFMVGLGFFHALRAATAFPVAAAVLRWVLVAALAILAGLSVYDAVLARRGRAADMVLKLPDPLRRRMQRAILGGARSAALVGGAVVLGAVVSLFELACTGQVYLPAVAWLVRTEGGLTAYLLLAVYNLGFILPLAAVFVLAWRGVSSRRLTALAQAHTGSVKFALATVFAALAVLTLVT
jgi:cytochrome c biogenesis protein CcdA